MMVLAVYKLSSSALLDLSCPSLMHVAVVRETVAFLEALRAESHFLVHKSSPALQERSMFLRAIRLLLVGVCARIEGGIWHCRRD